MSEHCKKMRLKFFAPAMRKILPSRPIGSRYLGLENIEPGTGKLLLDTEQEQVDSSVVAFDGKSVLFGKLRPYLAKVAIPDFCGVASTEIMVFEAAAGNDRRFLAYSLLSDEFIKHVSGMTDGAKMPRANPDDVLNMRLCAPEPLVQTRIATYLDEQTARIDRLMEMRRRQMELLKEQRGALIQQAVTRGLNPDAPMKDSGIPWLGEIPAHWPITKIKYLGLFMGGGTPFKGNVAYWDGTIPWVSPKDMKMTVIKDTEDHITQEGLDNSPCRIIPPDSLLMVVRSGILRNSLPVAINSVPVALNQDMRALIPNLSVSTRFLRYLFQGCEHLFLRLWCKDGSTVESVEHDLMASTWIALPDIDEQLEIVNHLDSQGDSLTSLSEAYTRQLTLLAEYRAALIHECVTGQREV